MNTVQYAPLSVGVEQLFLVKDLIRSARAYAGFNTRSGYEHFNSVSAQLTLPCAKECLGVKVAVFTEVRELLGCGWSFARAVLLLLHASKKCFCITTEHRTQFTGLDQWDKAPHVRMEDEDDEAWEEREARGFAHTTWCLSHSYTYNLTGKGVRCHEWQIKSSGTARYAIPGRERAATAEEALGAAYRVDGTHSPRVVRARICTFLEDLLIATPPFLLPAPTCVAQQTPVVSPQKTLIDELRARIKWRVAEPAKKAVRDLKERCAMWAMEHWLSEFVRLEVAKRIMKHKYHETCVSTREHRAKFGKRC